MPPKDTLKDTLKELFLDMLGKGKILRLELDSGTNVVVKLEHVGEDYVIVHQNNDRHPILSFESISSILDVTDNEVFQHPAKS